MPVTLYGRQNNSGTHAYLKTKLKIEFSPHAKEINGNTQIIEAVKADKDGLGYVGAGYVIKNGKQADTNIKILKIYEKGTIAYSPLDYDAVIQQQYYFQRPLFQYILKSSYAIAVKPEIIFMDEPCSALNPLSTQKIEELILALKKDYTIIIFSHNMQQAVRVSDFTAFMYLGELIEFDTTHKIFNNPEKN